MRASSDPRCSVAPSGLPGMQVISCEGRRRRANEDGQLHHLKHTQPVQNLAKKQRTWNVDVQSDHSFDDIRDCKAQLHNSSICLASAVISCGMYGNEP